MVWWVKPIVVNILEWVFAGIATFFFLLRFYIRYYGVRGQPPHFSFKLSDWVLTITLICFYAANISDTVTVVLIDDNWNVYATPENYCVAYFSRKPFVITIGMHAGTEILIFAFPFSFLYLIRRISKQKFYAVTMMFGVGFLGVIISLSRVAYIVTADHAPIIGIINAWGALEQCVGIIVCCLPAFKSLLKRRRSNNSGWDSSELVERTFNSDGAPESRGRSAESRDTLGCNSGSWNRSLPSDRQSVILRVDSFERISRMESVREVVEAETARREMVQDIKSTAPPENHNIR
ncbi:hypothetical protein TWF679_008568 [Orbilia oligospora]|uniref:Rhodopsin domain-containing protein n=1 Tax=Orbilia oligospora TaxID=2813651 RepID=A0A8H8V4J9_ORBOL|nr:hypothetical protein TWF679_008568 [Orbilia oligospora]